MAGYEELEKRRKAVADARANRSVLDSPLKKAGQWIFDLLYSDEPNPADFIMPAAAPETRALTPLAQGVRDQVVKLLRRVPNPIKAYHGSPHNFDQFSMSKIGTGEGAQSYGHGLYFAEAEPVANSYRHANTPIGAWEPRNRVAVGDRPLMQLPGFKRLPLRAQQLVADELMYGPIDRTIPERVQALQREAQGLGFDAADQHASQLAQQWMHGNLPPDPIGRVEMPKGHMYEVRLHADPNDLLDLDAPMGQQGQVVERLRAAAPQLSLEDARYAAVSSAERQRRVAILMKNARAPLPAGPLVSRQEADELMSRVTPADAEIWEPSYTEIDPEKVGRRIYDQIGLPPPMASSWLTHPMRADVEASRRLQSAGVPGLKYFDAFSRSAKEGTRNYVIWDDAIIEIARKYGIPLAAAASVYQAQQKQQQRTPGAGLEELIYGDHTGQKPGTVTKIR